MEQQAENKNVIRLSKRINLAETRLLSLIMADPKWIQDSRIDESIFVHKIPKTLFNAIKELVEQNATVTCHSILEKVIDYDIGIDLALIENIKVINTKDNTSSIDDILADLKKASKMLELSEKSQKISDSLNDASFDLDQIGVQVEDFVQDFSDLNTSQGTKIISLEEWLVNYKEKFEKRKDGKQYPFGDPLLDKFIIKGAAPGSVGILSSTTGMGKTTTVAYLQQCFESKGVPSLFLSLEMSDEDMMDRKISSKHKIPFTNVANPPTHNDFVAIERVIDQDIQESKTIQNFGFSDSPSWDLLNLRKEAVAFQQKIGQKYFVLFVDLLSMLKEFTESKAGLNFAQSIEIAMNKLNALAKELGIHIIGTVQFGRKADSVKIMDFDDIEYCKPTLNDLKNANAIAERARYVIGLFRRKAYAEKYLPDREETKKLEDIIDLMILKQNQGPTGILHYLFNSEFFTLTPVLTEDTEKAVKEIDKAKEEDQFN
jgi:replicative DNA helicase